MWLLIPQGFFSIVQKPGEEPLSVRARDAGDLDRLRAKLMPALSETVETRGGDYRYRAWISRDDLADVLAVIARELRYDLLVDVAVAAVGVVFLEARECGSALR